MAGSLNKVMIIGNLGADPEMRYTPNGKAVTTFRVAVNRRWTGQNGPQEETEWFSVETWDKLAEICSQSLAKGRSVYVEGRLRTRSWEGQDGQKRFKTEVIASEVKFLDPNPNRPRPAEAGAAADEFGGDVEPDDLPF